jgi:organic hydroperoxide reductase OsmC/OhrA
MAGTYPALLSWSGSTLDSDYTRSAQLAKPSGQAGIPVSSVPAFGGDGTRWNPEDLLAGALATCHMLTFLALAAKTRLDVRGYEDTAEAGLETVDRISRVAQVALRPTITVAPGTDRAKVEELFHKAHKYCVIANTVSCQVVLEPSVVEA